MADLKHQGNKSKNFDKHMKQHWQILVTTLKNLVQALLQTPPATQCGGESPYLQWLEQCLPEISGYEKPYPCIMVIFSNVTIKHQSHEGG